MHETMDLDIVASHEAGHVLLAHYYGRKVYGAYLSEQSARHERSHVRFALTPHIREIHLDLDGLDARWPLAVRETLVTTRILLAGPLAQAVYQQKPYRDMAGGQDYGDALAELLRLERLRLSLPRPHRLDTSYKDANILDTLADDILSLLQTPTYAHYLGLLAQGLLVGRELNGAQIEAMLQPMPRHRWPL
mgnify:CR=1 FL=1